MCCMAMAKERAIGLTGAMGMSHGACSRLASALGLNVLEEPALPESAKFCAMRGDRGECTLRAELLSERTHR